MAVYDSHVQFHDISALRMVQFNKHITLCLLFRSKPPASFAFRQGRQHAWSLDAAALPLPSPRPAVASSAPPAPERRKLEPLRTRRWRCRSQDMTVPWHTPAGMGLETVPWKTGKNRKKNWKSWSVSGVLGVAGWNQRLLGMALEDVWRANSSWGLSAMLTVHLDPRDGHLAGS